MGRDFDFNILETDLEDIDRAFLTRESKILESVDGVDVEKYIKERPEQRNYFPYSNKNI